MPAVYEFRAQIVAQMVALFVAIRGMKRDSDLRRFFLCLLALAVICALFTFWDLFFDRTILKSDKLDMPIYWQNRAKRRFGSFFLNPNYMGAFVVLVFPVAFVCTLRERRLWPRIYAWIGLLALAFNLVETQSRGPLLAFGACLMLLALGPAGGPSRLRRVGLLVTCALVLMLFMPGFYQHAVQRFDTLEHETGMQGRSRASTWLFTTRIIADSPLAGVGFGETQYMDVMAEYGFESEFGVESLDAPHNSYLQVAVYAGLPALAAFLLANVLVLGRAALLLLRRPESTNAPLVFGLAVGVSGFLVCIYPDIQLFTQNVGSVYWIFFALLLSLVTSERAAVAERSALPLPQAGVTAQSPATFRGQSAPRVAPRTGFCATPQKMLARSTGERSSLDR
jgi:hypothetical protein